MSKIEWTEKTWNPIVGCSIVSKGCTNCYAMRMAARIQKINPTGGSGTNYVNHYDDTTKVVNGNAVWTGKVALAPENILLEPLRRKKPTMYFVNSMGDLFHEDVPDEWIDRVFAIMALTPQHTYQVLTKRSARMREYFTRPVQGAWSGRAHIIDDHGHVSDMSDVQMRMRMGVLCQLLRVAPARALNSAAKWQDDHYPDGDGFIRKWPLPNVWLGVSTEDQASADERIPDLLATPAAVRFISAEPLIGPVSLDQITLRPDGKLPTELSKRLGDYVCPLTGNFQDAPRLDWVIVGGESGKGARPMHPDWARSLRDQCAEANVPFFFKQWGEWASLIDRDQDDPNWRRDYTTSTRRCILNLAGGCGFHGERVHLMQRYSKNVTGRLLDGREHDDMPEARR